MGVRKNKLIKVVAMILCCVVLLSFGVGCGKKEDSGSNGNAPVQSGDTNNEQEQEQGQKEDSPASDEKVVLTLLIDNQSPLCKFSN